MNKVRWMRANAVDALKHVDNRTLEENMYGAYKRYVLSGKSIKLYHGSKDRELIIPKFGVGNSNNDYGSGFYLTGDIELGKEWAWYNPEGDGYLHSYEFFYENLKVFSFAKYSALNWLAELLKYRKLSNYGSRIYYANKLIEKFGVDTSDVDIIIGWRADASYFQIAKRFIDGHINYTSLDRLMRLGNLKMQVCLKSEMAFDSIVPICVEKVDKKYEEAFRNRQVEARKVMLDMIKSESQPIRYGISYVLGEGFRE